MKVCDGYRKNISTSLQASTEISVTEIIFLSYEHNFPALAGKPSANSRKIYFTAGNFTRQVEKNFPVWTEQN